MLLKQFSPNVLLILTIFLILASVVFDEIEAQRHGKYWYRGYYPRERFYNFRYRYPYIYGYNG